MSVSGHVGLRQQEEVVRRKPIAGIKGINPAGILIGSTLIALVVEMQALTGGAMGGTLAAALGITATQASWAFLAPSIVGIATLGILTRIGDMYGHRKVLVFVLAAQLGANVLTALAWDFTSLTIGRALVGFTASQALTMAIMRHRVSPRLQEKGVGLIAGIQGIGIPISFMIAGGALSADLPWQSVFWLAVVLNAIALAVVLFAMPETERGERGPLDTPGAVLLGGWLSLLIIAINQSGTWGRTSSATLGCLAAAAIVFVLWQQREARFSSPLVPIGLVASRRLLPAMTVGICMGFASLTCYFGITGFAQVPSSVGYGFGLTLLGAGALLLPNGIGQTIVGFYAGRMVTAVGARNIMVVCMTLAAAVFAAWAVWHDSIWVFLVLQCVFVLTTMPTFAAGLTVAMTQAPDGKVAVVNGVYTVFTAVGAALAVAALTAFTSGDLIPGTPIPAESAWERVFIGGAAVCLIGALVALAIPKDVGRKAFDTASPQR